LLRIVEGLEGEVHFDVSCQPRFDFGALHPWLREHQRGLLYSAVGGDAAFVLTSDAALSVDEAACALKGELTVRAGERIRFSLVAAEPHELPPTAIPADELDRRLEETIRWWRTWVARGHYSELHRDAVVRSALVLKLLTCAPTGAIVAAPTTSLPESV